MRPFSRQLSRPNASLQRRSVPADGGAQGSSAEAVPVVLVDGEGE